MAVSTRKKKRAASVAAMERMSTTPETETPIKRRGARVGRGGVSSAGNHRSTPGSHPGAGTRRVRGRSRSRSDGSDAGDGAGGEEMDGEGDGGAGGDAGANDVRSDGRPAKNENTKRDERAAKKTKRAKSKTPTSRPRSGSAGGDVEGKDGGTPADRPDGTPGRVPNKAAGGAAVAAETAVRRFVASLVDAMPPESVSALCAGAEGGDDDDCPRRVLLERTARSLPADDPIRTALPRDDGDRLDLAAGELGRRLRGRRLRTLRDTLAARCLSSAAPGASSSSRARAVGGDGGEELEWAPSLARYMVLLWSDPELYCRELLGNDNEEESDSSGGGRDRERKDGEDRPNPKSVALRDTAAILSLAVATGTGDGEGHSTTTSRTVRCARLIRGVGEELGESRVGTSSSSSSSQHESGVISTAEMWGVCYHVALTTDDLDRTGLSSLPHHRAVPRDRWGVELMDWADAILDSPRS